MECLKGLEHKKMSDHCRSAVFEEEQEEVLIQGMEKRNPKSLQNKLKKGWDYSKCPRS